MNSTDKEDVIILGYGFFVNFRIFKRGIPEIEEILDKIYNEVGICLDYHLAEDGMNQLLISVDKIYSIGTLNLGSDDSVAFEVNEEEKKAIFTLAEKLKVEGKIGWYLHRYSN